MRVSKLYVMQLMDLKTSEPLKQHSTKIRMASPHTTIKNLLQMQTREGHKLSEINAGKLLTQSIITFRENNSNNNISPGAIIMRTRILIGMGEEPLHKKKIIVDALYAGKSDM
jgi:hypothetical protein